MGTEMAWGSQARTLNPPHTLSPSSMGTFTSCPLAFRFSYLERLPEAPTGARQQGHARAPRAPAPDVAPGRASARSTTALADLAAARHELAADPEFASSSSPRTSGPSSTPTPRCSSAATSRWRTRATVRVLGVELRVSRRRPTTVSPSAASSTGSSSTTTASSSSPTTRPAAHPAKAGSRRAWRACTSIRCCASGCSAAARRACSCCTCRSRSGSSPSATDQSLRGVEVKSNAVMRARSASRARATTSGRARRRSARSARSGSSAPSSAASPAQAAPVLLARQAEREGRPQLPLAIV